MIYKSEQLVEGIFINECKNRFLCEVVINHVKSLCYVPSSCKLDKLIDLKGKQLLLRKTTSLNAKTRYALFAMPYKNDFIILDSSMANSIVKDNIENNIFDILGQRNNIISEKNLGGYKCDLFIEDTETIIEVKSLITTNTVGIFPTVFSDRSIVQLDNIKKHLKMGKPACYIIVALNPYLNKIIFNKKAPIYRLFNECVDLGMKTINISCELKNNIKIKKIKGI